MSDATEELITPQGVEELEKLEELEILEGLTELEDLEISELLKIELYEDVCSEKLFWKLIVFLGEDCRSPPQAVITSALKKMTIDLMFMDGKIFMM